MIVRILSPEAYSSALETIGEAFATARAIPRLRDRTSPRSIAIYALHTEAAFWYREAIKAVRCVHAAS